MSPLSKTFEESAEKELKWKSIAAVFKALSIKVYNLIFTIMS